MAKYSIETAKEKDGRWIAEDRNVRGALAYGRTRQEAIENVKRKADKTRRPERESS